MKGRIMDAMIETKEEEDVPLRSSLLSPFLYGFMVPMFMLMLCGSWFADLLLVLLSTNGFR